MREVRTTPDFTRIQALPTRIWTPAKTEAAIDLLMRHFGQPGGTMRFLPWQAVAIADAYDAGGLFCQAPVGAGKTIPTAVIPAVVGAKRPVLLIKASLRDKTLRDFQGLAKHFKIHPNIRLVNYEALSSRNSQRILQDLRPDVIIGDEIQHLRAVGAARTRRFFTYVRDNPEVKCYFLSGSMARNALDDFYHLMAAALPTSSPMPYSKMTVESWAQALDAKVPEFKRLKPGVLLRFCDKEILADHTLDSCEKARRGLHRRMVSTLGVVTEESSSCQQPLVLKERPLATPDTIQGALDDLRNTWTTPNGEELMEAVELARKAREVITGYHGIWDPPAPKTWLEPRAAWSSFVRTVLAREQEHLDSPYFVAKEFGNTTLYQDWIRVKDDFVPNPVPVWISDYMVQDAARWMREVGGIVWVEHRAVGHALAALTGCRYFGGGQQSARDIRNTAEEGYIGPIICSVAAHSTGRNLQAYNRGLILSPAPNGTKAEQLIGRHHRQGQTKPVIIETYLHQPEFVDSLLTAYLESKFVVSQWGTAQKLTDAQWEGLGDLTDRATDAWRRKNGY